jgi:peptidoglycan/LPS O-acetylase OafA/YrhL
MLVGARASKLADAPPPRARKEGGIAYRPDIDGLRAIAVLAVLVYHAFPKALPGGFAGVDVFFVISGYLITGIIDRQMREKRFSIAHFYARRILRIFPALILVVLCTFVIGWFLLPVFEMEALGSSMQGAAAFVQNFMLHEQIVGYFDPGAERIPLLHLWSLGIEEQYYIVWPAALWLLSHWRARSLAIVAALAMGSFVVCVLTPSVDTPWAFYSPTTRGWELLAGSLLALWRDKEAGVANGRFSPALAWAGLFGLAIAFVAFNTNSPWPGIRTLLPVVAATALIATDNTSLHRRVLSAAPLVFIGLISYPLYLWHFPLIAFARLHGGGAVPASLLCALLVLSGVLACLTYRLVERPFRFGGSAPRVKIAPLVAAMVVLFALGAVTTSTHGLPIRFPRAIRGFLLTNVETASHWRQARCMLLLQPASAFAQECAGTGGHPLLVTWGDSYAAAFYPGLRHFAAVRGYDIAQYNASACPPLIGYSLPERPFCKSINDNVLTKIEQLRPDIVILDATWGHAEPILREDLPRTVARLKALYVSKIVLLGPPPGWQAGLPTTVLNYYQQTGAVLPIRTFYGSTDEWVRGRDALLASLSRELGIQYVSVRNVFCNEEGCLTRIGPDASQLTAFDAGHLTVPASIFLASHVLDDILGDERSAR